MNSRIYYSQEAEEQAKRQQALVAVLFTAFGLSIGAVIALLFAPRSGDETRHSLSEASGETLKRLEHDLDDLRKNIEDRVHA